MITDQDVKKLVTEFTKIFTTKEDLKRFATKDDLKSFATKDDLLSMEERFEKKFATKEDLLSMEGRFEEKFATKDDLKGFATKADLQANTDQIIQFITDYSASKVDLSRLENKIDTETPVTFASDCP